MQAERETQEKMARPLPEDTLWVRFVFVDHAGIPKAKAVHRDCFEGRARAGVGLAKGVLALDPSGALHPESGLSPVGECRLVPDLSTLTPLPVRPRAGDGLLRHDGARREHAVGGMPAQRPQAGARAALGERATGRSPPTRPSSTSGMPMAHWTGRRTRGATR